MMEKNLKKKIYVYVYVYVYVCVYVCVSLEKEMATPSSILAWEIPWTEEPGGLQSTGLPRVRHD